MKNRNHALTALALASLLLSGCAAAAGSVGAEPAPSSDVSAPARPANSPEAGPGSHASGYHGGATSSPHATHATQDGPSDAALMVCGDQPMDRLTSVLDLGPHPHTINNWSNNTFTCTYHLTEGALAISVQEAADQSSALKYFDAMQALAKDATPIDGLANLGFPAYETADGSAVFQKDNFILQVDASDLPTTMGPDNISRNALAYQLSTTILACWVEHP